MSDKQYAQKAKEKSGIVCIVRVVGYSKDGFVGSSCAIGFYPGNLHDVDCGLNIW